MGRKRISRFVSNPGFSNSHPGICPLQNVHNCEIFSLETDRMFQFRYEFVFTRSVSLGVYFEDLAGSKGLPGFERIAAKALAGRKETLHTMRRSGKYLFVDSRNGLFR